MSLPTLFLVVGHSANSHIIGSSQMADGNSFDALERAQVGSDDVRRFVSALRNTPCYSARVTGLRLHRSQTALHCHGDLDLTQQQQRGNGLEDRQKEANIECRLVSVDDRIKRGDT